MNQSNEFTSNNTIMLSNLSPPRGFSKQYTSNYVELDTPCIQHDYVESVTPCIQHEGNLHLYKSSNYNEFQNQRSHPCDGLEKPRLTRNTCMVIPDSDDILDFQNLSDAECQLLCNDNYIENQFGQLVENQLFGFHVVSDDDDESIEFDNNEYIDMDTLLWLNQQSNQQNTAWARETNQIEYDAVDWSCDPNDYVSMLQDQMSIQKPYNLIDPYFADLVDCFEPVDSCDFAELANDIMLEVDGRQELDEANLEDGEIREDIGPPALPKPLTRLTGEPVYSNTEYFERLKVELDRLDR